VDVEGLKEEELRPEFERSYASGGLTYEQWQPAYLYGRQLSNDPRYTGKTWDQIQTDVQRDYDREHPGMWERMKASIRGGYERMKNKMS
jgi:hypothetical protein